MTSISVWAMPGNGSGRRLAVRDAQHSVPLNQPLSKHRAPQLATLSARAGRRETIPDVRVRSAFRCPDEGCKCQARHMADDVVASQVADLQAECEEQARKNRFRRQFWRIAHTALGLPAAVLAAISGATGLSSAGARIPAAVLALVSAGLSAAITFLKPEVHHRAAHARRRAYLALEVEARFALTQASSRGEPVPLTVYRHLLERRRMIIAGQLDELVRRIAVGEPSSESENGG